MNTLLMDQQQKVISKAHGGRFNRACATPCELNKSLNTITKGFSLVELLIGLAVLAIILTLAVPSFSTMLMNARVTATADALVNSLHYARGAALSQSMRVQVCPIGALNSINCGSDWSAGWIVVTMPTSGTAMLLKSEQTSSTGPSVSSSAGTVIFDAQGLATTQSNFTVCDSRGGSFARSVQVVATGFVQSGESAGQAVWNNGALSCP